MPQILIDVAIYDGGGFARKEYSRAKLISNDSLRKVVTEEGIAAAHEALDNLINSYLNGSRGIRD